MSTTLLVVCCLYDMFCALFCGIGKYKYLFVLAVNLCRREELSKLQNFWDTILNYTILFLIERLSFYLNLVGPLWVTICPFILKSRLVIAALLYFVFCRILEITVLKSKVSWP